MRHLIKKTVVLLFTVFISSAAMSGVEEGLAAYKNRDYATALKELSSLAQNGDAKAQNILGEMYVMGNGVPKDAAKAEEWFQKAAAQGYAPALINIGNMYYNGVGVPKDVAKAVEWYQKAAAQGEVVAQSYLGWM